MKLKLLAVTLISLLGCVPAFGQADKPLDYNIRIYCDQHLEKIKSGLGGISLGGGAHSYIRPNVMKAIEGVSYPVVRLEAVPGSFKGLSEPGSDINDWSELDSEIEAIQQRNAEIILNIFYMATRLSAEPEYKKGYFSPPKDYKKWREFVIALVRHVNIEKKYGIKYWEFWNEPSGVWAYKDWPKDTFWKFYEVTARAIKEADPNALVGGFGDNAAYPEHLKRFFDYCKERNVPLDFVTLHWYGMWDKDARENPMLYLLFAQQTDALYRSIFGQPAPIFWTEWNHSIDHPNPRVEEQAAYVGASLFWMQLSPVEKALFFRLEPYGVANTKGRQLSTEAILGFDKNYTIQPSGRVLRMFSALAEQRVNVSNTPRNVTALASADGDRITAMITRMDYGATRDMNLSLNILGANKKGSVTIKTFIEDNSTAKVRGWIDPVTTSMEAQPNKPLIIPLNLQNFSAALVTIERPGAVQK